MSLAFGLRLLGRLSLVADQRPRLPSLQLRILRTSVQAREHEE